MATQTSQYQQNHPLPSPPQQAQPPQELRQYPLAQQQQQPQQQPQRQQQQQQQQRQQQQSPEQQPPQRQRAGSRRFSFRSDKSSRKGSVTKIDLHETHAEKDSRRIHGKADPTMAMNEAEPSVVALQQSSMAPLRSVQHKDAFGNPIADPDLSNPTRNRWERPLDTIRSFEAAIEGDYQRRTGKRLDTNSAGNWNRRSSYHPANQPRFPQDSYYGSRAQSFRGDGSQHGVAGQSSARNSYYDNGGYYTHNNQNNSGYGRHPSREHPSRLPSDPNHPGHGREQNIVYPLPNKDRSYETVTSAAASGNSDPAGYQTDPTSSDNSSIYRTSPGQRGNDYGIGFNQPQSLSTPALTVNLGPSGNKDVRTPQSAGYQNPAPAIPRKETSLLKRNPSTQQPATEKRKSWFSRRFSKAS